MGVYDFLMTNYKLIIRAMDSEPMFMGAGDKVKNSPADYFNHRSKTFKQNKRKQSKINKRRSK